MACYTCRGYGLLFLVVIIWFVAFLDIQSRSFISKVFDKNTKPEKACSTALDSSNGPEQLLFDKQNKSQAKIGGEMAKTMPRVPIDYWLKHKDQPMFYKNNSCARLPSIYELEYNNLYWQTLHTTNGTFYIFGTYYDIRTASPIGPAVRILGMVNRINPTVETYCQFWFNDVTTPLIVKTKEYNHIWRREWLGYEQGLFQPYLMTCQIPKTYHHKVPVSVSMVERPCDTATNNVKVFYDVPVRRKGFAVCVKGLDFLRKDQSVRLVEWIELLHILGAEKIFFYELHIHPNMSKVLRYYEDKGVVSVSPLTLPGGQPNNPVFQHNYLKEKSDLKKLHEPIPYNDCLYRNLYNYEYLALLDTDEVIMPVKTKDWHQLMDLTFSKSKNESPASFCFRNVHFLDNPSHGDGGLIKIPKYLHMLQHVYRRQNFSDPGVSTKCFHDPQKVLTLHNHFPLSCLSEKCRSHHIKLTDGHLHHYRDDCMLEPKSWCIKHRSRIVQDTKIWRFKDQLIACTTDTLRRLGFFGAPCSSE